MVKLVKQSMKIRLANPGSNRRDDIYGGSAENRIRFAIEVLAAMADTIGAGRVGFRISPGNPYNDMADPDPVGSVRAAISDPVALQKVLVETPAALVTRTAAVTHA